jgi:hypothetical protein
MKSRQIILAALIPASLFASVAVINMLNEPQVVFGQSEKNDQRKKIVESRRNQPGTDMRAYSPQMHQLYDGKFRLDLGKTYMVGGLFDKPGWDHIDNAGKTAHLVSGTVTVDVDEIKNTGKFVAKLKLPEGDFEMVMDRFHEFQPCQDGGLATMIYEHGDSGCGDANWPKTLIYLAGWGYADATLNGKPLYKDYQAHFMVTQGMRNRKSLEVNYPVLNKKTLAGQVNPATMQLDFYIRSKEADPTNINNPPRQDFAHFFCMEVTWK